MYAIDFHHIGFMYNEERYIIRSKEQKMEDNEIVTLLWERQESGIQQMQSNYKGYCMKIASRIVRNEEDASECINDVWLKVWKSIPPHRPKCLAGYLAKITRNMALDLYRKHCASKRGGGQLDKNLDELAGCISGADPIEEKLAHDHLKITIKRFLEGTEYRRRNIFLQRYFYMMDIAEIAQVMHMKESSVRSVLSRMRKELQSTLEKEDIWI